MNMAREGLLCSVVGEVPFVDVLNTMCDVSLPLTPPEWPEWVCHMLKPTSICVHMCMYMCTHTPADIHMCRCR